jgi:hypothetical protein
MPVPTPKDPVHGLLRGYHRGRNLADFARALVALDWDYYQDSVPRSLFESEELYDDKVLELVEDCIANLIDQGRIVIRDRLVFAAKRAPASAKRKAK